MRFRVVAWVGSALAMACQAPPSISIRLTNASFGTTGVNLYNCNQPGRPPNRQSLSTGGLRCDPTRLSKSAYSDVPVTALYKLGCGDDHAAVLKVTCEASDAGPSSFRGTVALGITSYCSLGDGGLPANAKVFAFEALGPGTSQTQTLSICDAFLDFCFPADACAFNKLSADITVANDVAAQ